MLARAGRKYGFVLSMAETPATIPSLWRSVLEWLGERPDLLAQEAMMGWVSNDEGRTYNGCHFVGSYSLLLSCCKFTG